MKKIVHLNNYCYLTVLVLTKNGHQMKLKDCTSGILKLTNVLNVGRRLNNTVIMSVIIKQSGQMEERQNFQICEFYIKNVIVQIIKENNLVV